MTGALVSTPARRFASRLVLASFSLVACDVAAPVTEEAASVQPSIVLVAPADFAAVAADVDGLLMEITKPGGTSRDTLIMPGIEAPRGARVRAVLRPDEGAVGTRIDVSLLVRGHVMFFASTALEEPQARWPGEVHLALHPLVELDLGSPRELPAGDLILFDELTPLRFSDGRRVSAADVSWSSTDESVLQILGSYAFGFAKGDAGLVASWRGRHDTLAITVSAADLILSRGVLRHHLGPGEVVLDSVSLTATASFRGAGTLTVSNDPAAPWLTGVLRYHEVPTRLIARIDADRLPPSGGAAYITVSSSQQGVEDRHLRVEAYPDPTEGVEEHRWERFCFVGDRVTGNTSPLVSSARACVSMVARAWAVGTMRHVTLEVRNLNGSLGDSLDTAAGLDVYGVGISHPSVSGLPALVSVRPSGLVSHIGVPVLTSTGGMLVSGTQTSIRGCGSPIRFPDNAHVTCDPQGYTGSVRADFEVAGTGWVLSDALPLLEARVPGITFSCSAEPDSFCVVF